MRLLCLLLVLAAPAYGEGQILLIDRSGSMVREGAREMHYAEGGVIKVEGAKILDLLRAQPLQPVGLFAFSDEVRAASSIQAAENITWSNGQNFGPDTYLNRAIRYAIDNRYSLAWIVTDNMQDTGATQGATQEFYDVLKTDEVKRVVVFPMKQPSGKRGVIIYAILLSWDADKIFQEETKAFASVARDTKLLPMKPLDRDTIETRFVQNSSQATRGRIFDEGKPIQTVVAVIKLQSNFEHMRIVDARITHPRVSPEFSKNSLLNLERDTVTITPEVVEQLDPQSETGQEYTVKVDLGKIKLKRDPVSLWKAAWKESIEDITLNLSFTIEVPKENFQLRESFLKDFNENDKDAYNGKIYDFKSLPQLMAQNMTPIEVPHKPTLKVRYPWWLAIIVPVLFPIVTVLLAGWLGLVAYRKLSQIGGNRAEWEVDVRSPAGGTGKVENGWVVVTAGNRTERLGQIKNDNFVPAQRVNPSGVQPIKVGEPHHLKYRNSEFSLIFRKKTPASPQKQHGKEKRKDAERIKLKI